MDIVFKAVFDGPESAPLTLDFVNAILEEAGARKATSLDIRAKDESDREFQLEIQVRPYAALLRRIIQNWARCYLAKLKKGMGYETLRPLISIWILGHESFSDGNFLHIFALRDRGSGIELSEDELIVTTELPVWARVLYASEIAPLRERIVTDLDRWLYYLWRGDELDPEALPPWLTRNSIQEALRAMATFTKSERARLRGGTPAQGARRRQRDHREGHRAVEGRGRETLKGESHFPKRLRRTCGESLLPRRHSLGTVRGHGCAAPARKASQKSDRRDACQGRGSGGPAQKAALLFARPYAA